MRHSPLAILFGLAISLFVLTSAQAQVIPPQPHTAQALFVCDDSKLYDANDASAPPPVRDSFAKQSSPVAFRVCHDYDGNAHYFVRAAYPKSDGVCRVLDEEVFPGSDSDGYPMGVGNKVVWLKGWKGSPPDAWIPFQYTRRSYELGFVFAADCPLGNDPRYISLDKVTDRMLMALQKAWDRVTVSREVLANEFSTIPTSSVSLGKIDPDPSQALRHRLLDDVFKRRSGFTSVSCGRNGCTANLDSVAVGFDFDETGIVFTQLAGIWMA